METLLSYSLKVSAAIAAFYLFYLLALRNRKDFHFNRIYLNASFFLSFLIPLITITLVRPGTRPMVILPEQSTPDVLTAPAASGGPDIATWIFCGMLVITAFFIVRLITGYRRAFAIVRKSKLSEISGFRVHISEDDIHPFTFFRKIVVPENIKTHPDKQIILKHERVHVQGRHTLDILWSEVLFLMQWFNPFARLMKDAIRNNLEFLTDQEVLQEADMLTYQLAMVSLAGGKKTTPFLNALNGNNLKNRIIMMKMKTENKNNLSRRLLVIPLLTILIAGLSSKEFKAAPYNGNDLTNLTALLAEKAGLPADTLKKNKKEVVVVGYPANKTTLKVKKAEDAFTRTKTAGQVQPVNEAAAPSQVNPANKEITVIGYGMKTEGINYTADSLKVRMVNGGNGVQPLYILDGKEIPSIDAISPESIESISVLKDASATALYGEKGKNGIIYITSKKKANPLADPLLLIDGKETNKKVNDIDPEDIQSVSVWKGEKAVEKYGKKGENGVIEIAMKASGEKNTGAINSIDAIRKHIAQKILYPVQAQKNGEQGSIRIYAFINGSGKITQITETKPKGGFQSIDEVVIVGYGSGPGKDKTGKRSTALNEEAALCIKNLPELNIPELKNSWVGFDFKFVLQ